MKTATTVKTVKTVKTVTLDHDAVLLIGPHITVAASVAKSLSRANVLKLTQMATLVLPAGEYPEPKKDRFNLFDPLTIIDNSNVNEVLSSVFPSRSVV